MRIKSSHKETQGDFIIIEDADFDAATMEVFVEGAATDNTSKKRPRSN